MIRPLIASVFVAIAILSAAYVALAMATPAHAADCRGTWVVASWYGAESGNRTASGKAFDGSQLVAAHRSLPFGTMVKFTYRGRSVTVPIEDRGPFVRGRTFDLSKRAAEAIGMVNAGVAKVCAEKL